MRTIRRTAQFKKDYKREKKGRHKNTIDQHLLSVVLLLVEDTALPDKYCDHALTGEWKDFRDCHVKPDLILIYRKADAATLELVRIGSHSELGV